MIARVTKKKGVTLTLDGFHSSIIGSISRSVYLKGYKAPSRPWR